MIYITSVRQPKTGGLIMSHCRECKTIHIIWSAFLHPRTEPGNEFYRVEGVCLYPEACLIFPFTP